MITFAPPPAATAVRAEISPGVWLDARRALWLAAERLLVVADLHWGYAASHRARGNLLPVWGEDELAARLHALAADYAPAEMIWLGDIVHAAEGAPRAARHVADSPVPIALIAGNHDRRGLPATVRTLRRGRWFFHHGDLAPTVPDDCVEVVGHHHPAATLGNAAGSRVKLPALVAEPRRLVLPAFSPWAAGTPWNERIAPGDTLWAIAPNRIFALPRVRASLSA